ncbi:MAG: polysaccharide biosynthesis C-terminal domain-containing protein, partial [Candidatus Bathyarchaeota archaeon]
AISTLFGVQYEFAPLYLALNAVSYLFSAFGNLSVGNLINSQGRTRVSLMFSLVASAIGFPLSLVLIPQFGVVGLIATTTITMTPVPLLGLWWIRKHYHVTVDWIASGKILLVAVVAAAVTYLTISLLTLPSWVELVIGTGAFLVIYLTIAPLMRAVNETDLQSLREMARALGPLFHVIDPLLAMMERLIPKA